MAPEIDLGKLTHAEKEAPILSLLPLVGQLEAALKRIAHLEARLALLEKPPKTPDNSSVPPSKGQKPSVPFDANKPPRKSRPGFGRTLEPNPEPPLSTACSMPVRTARPTGWPNRKRRNRRTDRIERLRLVFGELFGLSISEGALCNIPARAQAPLEAAATAIAAFITTSVYRAVQFQATGRSKSRPLRQL